jgi:iron uptake system component EfeO
VPAEPDPDGGPSPDRTAPPPTTRPGTDTGTPPRPGPTVHPPAGPATPTAPPPATCPGTDTGHHKGTAPAPDRSPGHRACPATQDTRPHPGRHGDTATRTAPPPATRPDARTGPRGPGPALRPPAGTGGRADAAGDGGGGPQTSGAWRRPRLRPAAALAVGVAGAVAAAVTALPAATGGGGGGGPEAADGKDAVAGGPPHTAVEVSPGGCGKGWGRGPVAGSQVFDLRNTGTAPTDVDLVAPAGGKVYGEVEGLAPGTARPLPVDLGSGTYAFRCVPEDADAVTGPSVVVPGHRPGGPGAVPVTQHDLIPPALAYQRWIGERTAELAGGTAALKRDIERGDLAAARRDWLPAHLVYARMGAAYGTFGDADRRIDGVAARTAGAVRDPAFTGFHRVEYGLWHHASAASLRGPAAALDREARALRDGWARARMAPGDLGLRAQEILENTARLELTGRTDYGSGTNLATARANVDGTRQVLDRLRALLTGRYPALPALDSALTRVRQDLDGARRDGGWTPPAGLPRNGRQRLNADVGDLLERLAPVAALLDARRTA